MLVSGFYARDTGAVRAVRHLRSRHPAPSLDPHTSEVAAAGSDAEDVFKIPIDDDTTGREISVRDFEPQSYTRDEVWLTILQVGDVKNLLRVVFQAHEVKLMEFLEQAITSTGSG